ncbi:MAG: hypothetical protein HY781_07880 [Chloroflexi bacterium]|nr:hypothetical protein [Chloroflexota bacterium]
MLNKFETQLSPDERKLLDGLNSPTKIQSFLNGIPYSADEFYRCPLRVLRERKAHCFDGALFAAMALRRIGRPPLILELIPNARDDDHILALFKKNDHWGAVAQSNFTGLRYREPVYRSLRELVMSYFEDFFNTAGEKTLVGYRGPINLKVFDDLDWMSSDAGLERLSTLIDRYRIQPVITDEMAASLTPVDERSLHAGLMGANEAGLFKI